MVKYSKDLDSVFAALADPTRRAIVDRLAQGDSTVTELAQPFDMSLPAVSKHLKYLERAGLLVREVDGRVHHCRLRPDPLQQAALWMNRYRHFWEGQFEALAQYLEETILESDETQDDEETDDNR
jgi:DNA-binding transcriptional ArsR family regulator